MANTNEPISDLLVISKPSEWQAFLFNLQCTLIESGHVGGFTEVGRADFAARLQGLYQFFGDLQEQGKKQ